MSCFFWERGREGPARETKITVVLSRSRRRRRFPFFYEQFFTLFLFFLPVRLGRIL